MQILILHEINIQQKFEHVNVNALLILQYIVTLLFYFITKV